MATPSVHASHDTAVGGVCDMSTYPLLPPTPDFNSLDVSMYQPTLSLWLFSLALQAYYYNCGRSLTLSPEWTGQAVKGLGDRVYALWLYRASDSTAVMVFPGTFYPDSWLQDMDYNQVSAADVLNVTDDKTLIHRGFGRIYASVRNDLWLLLRQYRPARVIITGHSLGGALATLAAVDMSVLQPIVYVFASPRVGNTQFVTDANSKVLIWSIRNRYDEVPDFPPHRFSVWLKPLVPWLIKHSFLRDILDIGAVKELQADHTSTLVYDDVGVPVEVSVNTGNMRRNHTQGYYMALTEDYSHATP